MKWEYLQAITKGLSLNDLLNQELIDNINENLDGKCVEAITIQLRVGGGGGGGGGGTINKLEE